MSKKVHVLDTNVVAQDPYSYKKIKTNEVILPIQVIEELDKLKTYPGIVGKNSRIFIRELDQLCNKGDLTKGIKLENKVLFKVEGWKEKSKEITMDNKILDCAIKQSKRVNVEVIVVSNDINVRVKARLAGLLSEAYENKSETEDLYSGHLTVIDPDLGAALIASNMVDVSKYQSLKGMLAQQFVSIVDQQGNGLALGRKVGNKLKIVQSRTPWGLSSRNKEQAYAIDLLCDPKIPLVTLMGKAGTGKSLCAVAAGLEMVLDKRVYSKFLIYRPIQPVGNDLGFLPGELAAKLDPWMGAVNDGFEYLFGGKNNNWKQTLEMYKEKGRIEYNAIAYIRGRSIRNAFILIDEAQNLTKEEIKVLLTRAGEGSKIVMTGDIEQIDSPKLDALNNGLSHVIESFKESELAGHISFSKGERSALATVASQVL